MDWELRTTDVLAVGEGKGRLDIEGEQGALAQTDVQVRMRKRMRNRA